MNVGDKCYKIGGDYVFHGTIVAKFPKLSGLIRFVVEDNGLSTNTPTQETWGVQPQVVTKVIRYDYQRKYPHVGIGKRITF